MSRHAALRTGGRRRRWFGQGRTRALLSLGLLAALGVASTSAYWTDEGTITGGTISSATLDLTAGPTTGAENLPGTGPNNWNSGALALSNLIPNESVAQAFVVRNSGVAPLRFNATVSSTTNDLTSGTSGLQVQVYDNGTTVTSSGTQAAGNRTASCNGTLAFSGYVSTTASGNVFTADIPLATTGATHNVCVRAWLNSAAGNALQNKSTQVVVSLTAIQVSAP
jgi:predicted ribosomally synthesized peptide with SipW-like signal peptide